KGEGREPTYDQLVRVRPQGDGAVRVVEQGREAVPHLIGHSERALPLVVHELGGVEPGALLRVEAAIGPGLVRVAGEEQAVGNAEPGVVRRERVWGRPQRLQGHHTITAGCGWPRGRER